MRLHKVSLFALSLATLAFPKSQAITVKGSDTMVILAQRWAEVYMKAHHPLWAREQLRHL